MADACSIIAEQGGGFIVEQPASWAGGASMFDFTSFKRLVEQGGRIDTLDQCTFAAPKQKPTALLHRGVHLDLASTQCSHQPRWLTDLDAVQVWAKHVPHVGHTSAGTYSTAKLAAYPSRFNEYLASAISASFSLPPTPSSVTSPS